MLDFGADANGNFLYSIHERGNQCKAEHVYQQKNGVGHERIYFRKNGERAVVVGAYEEHIE